MYPFHVVCILFFNLNIVAWFYNFMMNKSEKRRHSWIFSNFWRQSLQSLIVMLGVDCLQMPFIKLRLYLSFLDESFIFITKACWILSNVFTAYAVIRFFFWSADMVNYPDAYWTSLHIYSKFSLVMIVNFFINRLQFLKKLFCA